MIVVLKDNPDQKQLDNLVSWLKSMGLDIHYERRPVRHHHGTDRRHSRC